MASPPSHNPAEDDELVMDLVDHALLLAGAEREQYFSQACAGNAALLAAVRRYVSWDERIKDFLVSPVSALTDHETAVEKTMAPGRLLAKRFRIIRNVASGGMGTVYEALDEKLGRRIAVKCARSGFGSYLSPETLHASEINHPNICKTWEIHTVSEPGEDFDFLTMEFIEGKTLAEALATAPLPLYEARAIATQLCAGLAEAHRHHVVHGDLKTNNVLLAEEPEGVRAVITDFGLARGRLAEGTAGMSGKAGGTMDYMAPELLRGARPSAASDLYALGVILHLMASGRTPFPGTVSIEERLGGKPEGLKHPWGSIIGRCLEPEPQRRYSNASEVAGALAPFPLARWLLISVAVLAAATAGALGNRATSEQSQSVRLAVLPFATDAAGRSLTEGLVQEATDRLRGIHDQHKRLTVISVRNASVSVTETADRAATRLGATHLLTGTVHRKGTLIDVHATVADARTRLILKEFDGEYQPVALGGVPSALAGLVTGTLRLQPLAPTATVSPAAYADFAAGVGLLQRDSGVDAALPLLARAVAVDPASPLTHARLAEAEARKYRLSRSPEWLDRASRSFQEAEERNPDLGVVWLVSARINEYGGFYERAEADLQRALQIDPRAGDAWRRLGQVYQENNRFAEAVVAFRKAIEVQPEEFANYQDLCALYTEQAEYVDAIQECRKMATMVPDFSDAHFGLAIPYFESGDYVQSEREFQLALRLDPMSAKAMHARAFALTSVGRGSEAMQLFQRALSVGPPTHLLYAGLGTAYRLGGAPVKAREAYRRGLTLADEQLEKNPRDAIVRAQLAYICAQLRQRGRARSEAKQARQFAPESIEVAWWLVLTWDALNEPDAEFQLLERMPETILRRIAREKDLAELRGSVRFQELLRLRNIH